MVTSKAELANVGSSLNFLYSSKRHIKQLLKLISHKKFKQYITSTTMMHHVYNALTILLSQLIYK